MAHLQNVFSGDTLTAARWNEVIDAINMNASNLSGLRGGNNIFQIVTIANNTGKEIKTADPVEVSGAIRGTSDPEVAFKRWRNSGFQLTAGNVGNTTEAWEIAVAIENIPTSGIGRAVVCGILAAEVHEAQKAEDCIFAKFKGSVGFIASKSPTPLRVLASTNAKDGTRFCYLVPAELFGVLVDSVLCEELKPGINVALEANDARVGHRANCTISSYLTIENYEVYELWLRKNLQLLTTGSDYAIYSFIEVKGYNNEYPESRTGGPNLTGRGDILEFSEDFKISFTEAERADSYGHKDSSACVEWTGFLVGSYKVKGITLGRGLTASLNAGGSSAQLDWAGMTVGGTEGVKKLTSGQGIGFTVSGDSAAIRWLGMTVGGSLVRSISLGSGLSAVPDGSGGTTLSFNPTGSGVIGTVSGWSAGGGAVSFTGNSGVKFASGGFSIAEDGLGNVVVSPKAPRLVEATAGEAGAIQVVTDVNCVDGDLVITKKWIKAAY